MRTQRNLKKKRKITSREKKTPQFTINFAFRGKKIILREEGGKIDLTKINVISKSGISLLRS